MHHDRTYVKRILPFQLIQCTKIKSKNQQVVNIILRETLFLNMFKDAKQSELPPPSFRSNNPNINTSPKKSHPNTSRENLWHKKRKAFSQTNGNKLYLNS